MPNLIKIIVTIGSIAIFTPFLGGCATVTDNTPVAPSAIENPEVATPATPMPSVAMPVVADKLAAPTSEANANAAQAMREQAAKLWQEGKQEQALALVTQAIQQYPNDVDNYIWRSIWLNELQRYDAAIADAKRVTELAPNNGDAWNNLGWNLILKGEFAAAQPVLTKAQQLLPDSYAVAVNLGHTYLLQGDSENAYVWYEKSIPLIPDEAALKAGPLADFKLFIEKKWQPQEFKKAKEWLVAEYKKLQHEQLITAIALKKKELGGEALTGYALAWWQEFEKSNADKLDVVLVILKEIELRKATMMDFFMAYVVSKADSIPGILEYMDKQAEAEELNSQVVSLYNQGKYAEAIPLAERALAIREKVLGADHPATATSLNNLAELYGAQGKYAQADSLYQRALAINEKVLGAEHPHTATSLNNLAALYEAQGKYAEAESLYQRALAIREKVLGAEHATTASSLNNLAGLYRSQGKYAEAEPLYQRALAIYEKVSGLEHPDTATSLNNLAVLYEAQGKYAEAEPLHQRALAIREKVLGAEHPDTATSLNSLALLYHNQGKYAQAEPLYQRALAIDEKVLGAEHADTANDLNNLAGLYENQGKYTEAEPLCQRALAINEKVLGPEHPATASSLNNLAEFYRNQGKYAEAEPLYQRALAIYEKVLGAEHPYTATSLNNLAGLYETQGKYAEAEPLCQRALAINEKVLGPEHPATASSLNNLAEFYRNQGKYAEAEPLYRRSLAIKEKVLGAEHPDTATILNNLAALYYSQGNYTTALEFIRRAVHIQRSRILTAHQTDSNTAEQTSRQNKHYFYWHLKIAAAYLATNPQTDLSAETLESSQLHHDGSVGNAIAQMAVRFASGNAQLVNLVRTKQDTTLAWKKTDEALITAIGAMPDKQNPELIKNLRIRKKELTDQLTALNERLAKEFPDYFELTVPKPLELTQTQQLLNPTEALIAYVLGEEESFVWLITPNNVTFRQIERNQTDIAKQVAELRTNLSPDTNPRLQQFYPVATAYALYRDLLEPETAQLTTVKTLFIVADSALESLPFSVLVTAPPPANPSDYQQVAWLSRTLATVTLPTVSSLRALRVLAKHGPAAEHPFIGFGDPNFSGTAGNTRGAGGVRLAKQLTANSSGLADPQQLSAVLPPLPETADELRAIAQTLGANDNNIYLQNQASVTTVNATDLSQYRVVDFATHALVAGQVEEYKLGNVEPAIALTPPPVATVQDDGLLRASQVAQLKLNADWVVLSACNTAAADGSTGAVGLSGLAKAFFYAGARALLVSHWSVLSKPAVALTTTMFKTWQDNPQLGRAEALRQAQMQMLDHPEKPYFTHPASWGAFVVAGEGGIGK